MFHAPPACWLAIVPAMAACAAAAQSPPPQAAAPLRYTSVLEGYQPHGDGKPIDWLRANETVRQRGGWKAYAQESNGAGEPGKPPAHAGHAMPAPAPAPKVPR